MQIHLLHGVGEGLPEHCQTCLSRDVLLDTPVELVVPVAIGESAQGSFDIGDGMREDDRDRLGSLDQLIG